ncbi:tRNA (N6-threonylcarbamoyladenosine(37)-N6)-methyltransferase TrmO [Thiospirillum jenense]|uniref:tRNA (N6-threonylcarbamoyladenosine(37)-N6)-methyltransferase TrmO n=1 Tax=Thiospirillum jenense TaxID=1653858 RepID=A0A839HDR6_9GAMM|nr:tRNA (N6-threonylcarbamoyladenosine(37)-N6)-methyltransferase TrmO [Thiospirillum jenense]MBB1127023.1 tRNA (N6-threonylcarbamoyladenosine(37)-N6)-methyltransferase TrmO [Thiospirillum jenense]
MQFTFKPIGIVRSPFNDKFGIPRQPRLVEAATARLQLLPPYDREEAFVALDGFSHVWLIFVFHADCLTADWHPMVRPPRLGGRAKVGVFASRAPYRPNPIGISAVAHRGLERTTQGLALCLQGVDLLDGTPVLDVKPYVPYTDSIPTALGGFAHPPSPAPLLPVVFSQTAQQQLVSYDPDERQQLRDLIMQVIAQDPRPGYMDRYPQRTQFNLRLLDYDIAWEWQTTQAVVMRIIKLQTTV